MKNLTFAATRRSIGVLIMGAAGLLASCSTSEVLKVRQFHLSSVDLADRDDAKMVRGEQRHRLRGAVTLKEREERLGQYYTISWVNTDPSLAAMKLVMDYQQTATGSQNLRMTTELPAGQASGRVEFKVSGKAYQSRGRVLAWRIRLMRGNTIVAEKRSYLWR